MTRPSSKSLIRITLFLLLLFGLSSCAILIPKEAGIGKQVDWEDLPGWEQDNVAQSWPALLSQCQRFSRKPGDWQTICQTAKNLGNPSDSQARAFLQTHFQPHEVVGTEGNSDGLITGYYEPKLYGSLQPDQRFAYPLYGRPGSLLIVELGELYPSLKGKRVRGRLEGNRVIPYFEREAIDSNKQPLQGEEIIWVDNPHDAFFLQIQGSGRIEMPDGSMVKVGYADQNGHRYVSIGKRLIEWGELKREEVSLFTIRQWLQDNSERASQLMNENPSYVFFVLKEDDGKGPTGSLNVPLTTERSAAVDRSVIPLGTPLWLSTTLPEENGAEPTTYQRLLFAQDTGGAINGPVRVDVFFGNGDRAEQLAGTMKQQGRLFALLPKKQP